MTETFVRPANFLQTCHFDLRQNLNENEKKSEYTEKFLNLTIKKEIISTKFKAKKNLNLESGYLYLI